MRSGFRQFVAYGMLALASLGIFLKGFQDPGYWVAGGIALVIILAAVGVGNLIANRLLDDKGAQPGPAELMKRAAVVGELGSMLQQGAQMGEALRRIQAGRAHGLGVL